MRSQRGDWYIPISIPLRFITMGMYPKQCADKFVKLYAYFSRKCISLLTAQRYPIINNNSLNTIF
jgi:hypothetical protein